MHMTSRSSHHKDNAAYTEGPYGQKLEWYGEEP